MNVGDKVYSKEIKNYVDNYRGIILEDLGDQFVVLIKGMKTLIQKDRVTTNLKQLLDVALD
jgi:hypothetical protein